MGGAVLLTIAAVAGLAAILVFLVPKTIEAADRWASVLGGLSAYIALVGGLVVWAVRSARSGASDDAAEVTGEPFGHQAPGVRPHGPVRQLPLGAPIFVGRREAVERAQAVLRGEARPRVINIHGLAGVGKPKS